MEISISTLTPVQVISSTDSQSTATEDELLSPIVSSNFPEDTMILSVESTCWMQNLDDNLRIDKINLPGTHDTGALFGGEWFECQTMTIKEQLHSGIRFLDIRCRHIENRFAIHHAEVFQNLMFEDVLEDCKSYLKQYSSEFLIIRIKPEHEEENCNRSFAETFMATYFDPNLFYTGTDIPTVKEIRGKIYVLQQFPADYKIGTEWKDINLQDDWDVKDYLEKKKAILHHYTKALQRNSQQNIFYINFCSGTGMAGTPLMLSRKTNDLVLSFTKGPCGIIVMDYPQNIHIRHIINLNFKKQGY